MIRKVLIGGTWVEKPVKIDPPTWRVSGGEEPSFSAIGMTKSTTVDFTGGSEWKFVSGWTVHPSYPGSTVVNHALRMPADAIGQFRVRALINSYPPDVSTVRMPWRIVVTKSGSYSVDLIESNADSASTNVELSALHTFQGDDALTVWVKQFAIFDTRVDTTMTNFVIVEPV